MIDPDLFSKLTKLSPTGLGLVRLSIVEKLLDSQLRFSRGEITESELLSVTMAANDILGGMPTHPGMTEEECRNTSGATAKEVDLALRERAKVL